MYTSVNNSTSLTTTEIDMSFSAHYKGLFFSTGGSIETKDKKSWESYRASSRTTIKGSGGDVALLSRLTEADPFKPNGHAYEQWLESTKKTPVSTSFELKGIWLLIADQTKRKQMERAFHKYAQSFRLAMTFENFELHTRLTVDATVVPEPARADKNDTQGWRLTVLDRQTPSKVVHNKSYPYNPNTWRASAPAMYKAMIDDVNRLNLNNRSYIVVASTYGIVLGLAPPSNEVYEFLLNAGGGKQLEFFENVPRFSANPNGVIRYAMIGVPKTGKGAGIEVLSLSSQGKLPSDINAKAFLYKSVLEGDYNLGREGRLSMEKEVEEAMTEQIAESAHAE
jgi:hypothetical protein